MDYKDSFQFLIAVMLSANTSDARVNKVTPELFANFGTSKKMSEANFEDISRLIMPCGQWKSKSRRLIDTAKIIFKECNGIIPCSKEALKSLPGVGEKTAAVYRSQMLGIKSEFPVDRHIIRLANRWMLSASKNPNKVSEDLKKVFAGHDWKQLHMKMIAFGRKNCRALSTCCRCTICCRFS